MSGRKYNNAHLHRLLCILECTLCFLHLIIVSSLLLKQQYVNYSVCYRNDALRISYNLIIFDEGVFAGVIQLPGGL